MNLVVMFTYPRGDSLMVASSVVDFVSFFSAVGVCWDLDCVQMHGFSSDGVKSLKCPVDESS